MNNAPYSREERKIIREYIAAHPDQGQCVQARNLAKLIRRTPEAIRYLIRYNSDSIENGEITLKDLVEQFPILKPSFQITPPVILTGDWHCPYIKLSWFRELIRVARKTGVKTLAVVGDFHNFDFFSKYRDDSQASAEKQQKEFVIGDRLLGEALTIFSRVYFCFSGHDRRPNKLLQGALTPERWYGMIRPGSSLKDVFLSPFSWVEVGEQWIAQHPRIGRKLKGSFTREMVARKRKSMATFHQHYSSWALDPSGTDACYDVGTMCDRAKIGYMNADLGPYPESDNAFLVIDKKERGHLFVDHPRYPSVDQMLCGINS